MEASPETSGMDSINSSSSPGTPLSPTSEPPLLPQEMQRWQTTCWFGVVFGGLITLLNCGFLIWGYLEPGPPVPLSFNLATFASAFQAMFAAFWLYGRQSARNPFVTASAAATLCYFYITLSAEAFWLAGCFLVLVILTFIPLLIVIIGTFPKIVSSLKLAEETVEPGQQTAFVAKVRKAEDLY